MTNIVESDVKHNSLSHSLTDFGRITDLKKCVSKDFIAYEYIQFNTF